MDRITIEKTVLTVLEAVLKQPFKLGLDINRQNTPSWDSLKHIEIIFALEDELGVNFLEDELADLDSVEKIVASIHKKQ
jgi:acyl carrier protein